MKFIHAADIHLGSPFQGLKKISTDTLTKVVNSTGDAFKKLVQHAIKNKVDFICIVGDLFDNPEPSLETLELAVEEFEKLKAANIPVFLSYGNHDYLNAKIPSVIFPDNVNVFGNQVETKELTTADGALVGLTGFSYDKRAEVNARIDEYPSKENRFDFQIGMLHGSMDGINSTEAHYAPFTQLQLISKKYDYWALGHIHKRQEINSNPVIAYSGNTQGRHINEKGSKGISLVTIKENGQTNVEFLKTNVIEWSDIDVVAKADMTLTDLMTGILQKVDVISNSELHLININLLDSNALNSEILDDVENGLVLSQVQKQVDAKITLFYRITPKTQDDIQIFSELDQEYWQKSADQVFNVKTIQKALGRLLELDFVADEYDNQVGVESIQDQVKLMLKQRNALGDE